MSDNKWTGEQLEAITLSGCNLLVAAAAGAGKTAVLVERIIRKITEGENPVDIDRLLIVTFTNAAAAEMRERIGDAIARALERNPDSRQLQRQLMLLNKASITTMHSFCLEVIKNGFHYIELDPNFRIADETEAALMKLEVLEELFEDKYEAESPDEEFLHLVECYSGSRDDKALKDMVLNLYEFVQSHPWPEKWLKEHAAAFDTDGAGDFANTVWAKVLIKTLGIEFAGFVNMLEKAVGILRNAEGLEPYLPVFQEDLSNLKGLLDLLVPKSAAGDGSPSHCPQCDGEPSPAAQTWDTLYKAFTAIEFGTLARCKKDADRVKQEQVKEIRNDVKERVRKIREELFSTDSSGIAADLQSLYPLMKCLAELANEFNARYSAKKRERALLDFNDLEHFCLEILTEADTDGPPPFHIAPSRAALDMREKFVEILVDEYQDSNLVQEVIINTISKRENGTPNVFMVGDVKQSIYRFRQARPELFMQKYNSYSAGGDGEGRKIQLYKNFRSRQEVIAAVNFIFSQIMSETVGELDYNHNEALNLGADYGASEDPDAVVGGAVELHIIDTSGDGSNAGQQEEASDETDETDPQPESEEAEEQPDDIQTEARLAANRIKELTGSGGAGNPFKVFDKSKRQYRDVEYKDMVILLRTTRNWADIFMEELGLQGIPAYADTGTGYFKTIEIQTVLSLLQILDNPMQDIPLLSVMRSPIAAFSTDELADIRLADREATFYEAVRSYIQENNGATAEKARVFLDKLDQWRNKAAYLSTSELIWSLYNDTGYYSYAGAMPGGIQRQANLRLLFDRARQFEETSYKGLFNFINFINRLKSGRGDLGSAKILGENENVVRIMSIHKSKGLEFPVVFVAGCGKPFNFQDMNKSILLHQDLGFGPEFVDCSRRISYATVPKQALKYKLKLETLSEEMRILYVAFTRAREKLIITGAVKGIEQAAGRWSKSAYTGDIKLPRYEMLKSRNYLDWIGPSVSRHKDGERLRSIPGMEEIQYLDDSSIWEINLWNKKDILAVKDRMEEGKEDLPEWLDRLEENVPGSQYRDTVSSRLSWKYPYMVSGRLPTKISVTELKRRFHSEIAEETAPFTAYMPPLVKKPVFLEEDERLTAAEKGSILHFVMQHLELAKASKVQDIKFQIGEMVFNELLTEQQARTVDINRIHRFLCSGLGARLLDAEKVNREVPFNIEVSCREIYGEMPQCEVEDTILLQGVVDCYFLEDDEIVLIDYKTDYVPDDNPEAVKEKYRIQIEYYSKALERITGKRVKEKYVYLFWNGQTISY